MLRRSIFRSAPLALGVTAALGVVLASHLRLARSATSEAAETRRAMPAASQPAPARAPGGIQPAAAMKIGSPSRAARSTLAGVSVAAEGRVAPLPPPADVAGRLNSAWIPEGLRDSGFDRYVDWNLLGNAWEEKNASALADAAMQFREGERILMRPHRGLSSEQLLQEAARIAAETKDTEAMRQIARIAETTGNTALKSQLADAEKLVAPARATDPALLVSLGEVTPQVYGQIWEYRHAIRDASLAGDTASLKDIRDDVARNTDIPQKQKEYLRKLSQEGEAATATLSESQRKLAGNLDKLADNSRRGGGGGGGNRGGGGGRNGFSPGRGISNFGGTRNVVSQNRGSNKGRWKHRRLVIGGGGQYYDDPGDADGDGSAPAPAASIVLVNPQSNGQVLSYQLDGGDVAALGAGYQTTINQQCVISFDRGNDTGQAQYTLTDGTYTFQPSNGGWDLFHTDSQ